MQEQERRHTEGWYIRDAHKSIERMRILEGWYLREMHKRLEQARVYDTVDFPRYRTDHHPPWVRDQIVRAPRNHPVRFYTDKLEIDPIRDHWSQPMGAYRIGRIVSPSTEFDPFATNHLPLPNPGAYGVGRLRFGIHPERGPFIDIKRGYQPDGKIDDRGRDWKDSSASAYRTMLLIVNNTVGMVGEAKEIFEALRESLVVNNGKQPKTANEVVEALLDGTAEVDWTKFLNLMAMNWMEDIAYGIGGRVSRQIQERLRVPPGLISAWNHTLATRETGMDTSISGEIGKFLMERMKDVQTQVIQPEPFELRTP